MGLSELHKKEIQIVHRDIKPKNILIYEDTCEPLIADFGSIKHFNQDGKIGGSRTTTLYMPPEIIKGENYTTQSDIYQLGVSMFQILGGFFPDTYAEWLSPQEQKKLRSITSSYEQSVYVDKIIFAQISKGKLLRYDTLPPFINKAIVNIIKKATHINLRIRYANTGEFLNDLYKVQKRLINWKQHEDGLYATKPKGEQFRILESKKGFSTERLGLGGWRRAGEFTFDIYKQLNKLN